MAECLNARTRRVVNDLISGNALSLGGKAIAPFGPDEARLLGVLAGQFSQLREDKGTELARRVAKLFADSTDEKPSQPQPAPTIPRHKSWRLFDVKASSFRGLAPASCVWQHDFAGQSHLLYGPNGCGKSSLLGAVTWCLTGHVFRDDRAPSPPEDVTVFTTAKRATVAGVRSDGLTLTDEAGTSTPLHKEFWVELYLGADGGSFLWIRRHSVEGLATSKDGDTWTPITKLEDVGISDLDTELQLLMPARVPHIRFGKDADLVRVFAQVVGLDDLEEIADLAGRTHSASTREVTRLEQNELTPLRTRITECVNEILEQAPDTVRGFQSFACVSSPDRNLDAVKSFDADLTALIEQDTAQLVRDLGISLPTDKAVEEKQLLEELDNLPGQVQSATDEMAKQLSALFPNVLGLKVPSGDQMEDLVRRLYEFERAARVKAHDRLVWGLRASADVKMDLMLTAAAHFPEGSRICPVCSQNLESVPDVRDTLERLRALAAHAHLHKEIDDLQLSLLADLDGVISCDDRLEAETSLADRLCSDWLRLKELRFPGLLQRVAERFDSLIAAGAEQCRPDEEIPAAALAAGFEESFPEAFQRLDDALGTAHRYVRFVRAVHKNASNIADLLMKSLKAEAPCDGKESLLFVLRRGRTINERVRILKAIRTKARQLLQDERKRGEIASVATLYQRVATATEGPKGLATPVRQEVIGVMKDVEPRMKGYYQKLYGDDGLAFDMVTTGHAANPRVKNELNVYLRAGGERVPSGPYANAGRLRALTLSFVFALLEKSGSSLSLVILDDPALSLDDEHKARLLDHLVRPCLGRKQVILATHYERFFKLAEPVFSDAERLQLAPRRSVRDAVAFEPSDLLHRFDQALLTSSGLWRETGVNLRRWVERVLHTLSGYCPQPFVRFNDIPGSIANYASITDTGVATNRRDKIVAALSNPAVKRVIHPLAHDEEPTETEARDALGCLKGCREDVDAEISRLKQLWHHDLLGRAIEERPRIVSLRPTAAFAEFPLSIEGAAAAAHNGVGITWVERAVGNLAGHGLVLVKLDTLAPIASVGNYLLLDPKEVEPEAEDLTVLQTENGERYVRRFWSDGHDIHLQAANPNVVYAPVRIRKGECSARRVVGVFFDGVRGCRPGKVGEEWVCPGAVPTGLLKDVVGIRVRGTSLEPLARDSQVVLVRKHEVTGPISQGALACVDIRDVGAVIKRCYPGLSEWILCPVNTIDVEAPIRVAPADILRVFLLVGVLFEISSVEPENSTGSPVMRVPAKRKAKRI